MTTAPPSTVHREYLLSADSIEGVPPVTIWENGQIRVPGPEETDRILQELLGPPIALSAVGSEA